MTWDGVDRRTQTQMSSLRHGIYEWLMISASIAVLLMVWHMTRAMYAISTTGETQLHELREIHNAIHEEGRK